MDQVFFKLLPLLLLTCIGCCFGQDDGSAGLVDAIMGEDVNLKLLVEKKKNDLIVWNFRHGEEWITVATLRESGLHVTDQYKGRASIDSRDGSLSLSMLNCDDSGDYSFNLIGSTVKTGQIKLRVVATTIKSEPTSSHPGAPEQRADCFLPLVVCSAVSVVLLVGFLLLLWKICNGKQPRASNKKPSNIQKRQHAVSKCDESDYDTLNMDTMDKDQTYSTLYCRRF